MPRAAELDGHDIRHPIVVVGAGPVGLCCALALAHHGMRVVVVDGKTSVSDGSRAICIARHSLEIFQQLGVADRFLGKALPWTHGTSFYREEPVFRLEMPHDADERFFPMYNLQQQYIELFLAEAAAAEPLIELRWGHRLLGLTASDDGVRLAIDCAHGDYMLAADWLVAADGARSQVRQALDLPLRGEAYEGRYVIVDVHLPSDYPTERRAFFDPPANPGATVLVHKQPDDIWRIDYQLGPDDDESAALAEPAIRARVAAIVAMLGERAPWSLVWWSLYKAYTLCLDDYRHGRVLFAGDAAHLVPIFGVRGLNSGLADVANLAWKLAYVGQGRAPHQLLDSYTPERRGATLDIFERAGKSTRFMTPPSRGQRLVRDAALELARHHDCVRRLLDPRQSVPYSYITSPLTSTDPVGGEAAGPCPGSALPNVRLGADDFLLDRLGPGFNLITIGAAGKAGAIAALGRHAARRGIPFNHVALKASAAAGCAAECGTRYAAPAGSAWLARPDRHVCARWTVFDSAAACRALDRAAGWRES
ncbi:MAG: FAD-dependent monooxygenase [Gammaproteobacteria bacterium]